MRKFFKLLWEMMTRNPYDLPPGPEPIIPEISDDQVEAAIEAAGRSEVFALARENGWSASNTPPKWVWVQLAFEVRQRQAKLPYPAQTFH